MQFRKITNANFIKTSLLTTLFFIVIMVVNYELGMATTDPGGGGVDQWNAIMDMLTPWVQRLGGVVTLVGGVMFGLGFKNDDADTKTRGLQTIIAGSIVIAVGTASATFLVP